MKKLSIRILAGLIAISTVLSSCSKETTTNENKIEKNPVVNSQYIQPTNTEVSGKPGPGGGGGCPTGVYNLIYHYNPNTILNSQAHLYYNTLYDDYNNLPCGAIEYAFTGTDWNALTSISERGLDCLTNNGGTNWRIRISGNVTFVWAPKSFVISCFGSIENFSDNIRLAKVGFYESKK